MWGSIVGAVASKVLDKGIDMWAQSRERRAQQDWQEQMQNTAIQRRVADATAAGVHPLFALGAQTTSPQPIGIGSMESQGIFGPALASAVKREETADLRAARELTMKEIASRIDLNEAHAQYYRSSALGRSGANPAPSVVGGNFMEGSSVPYHLVDMPEAVQLDFNDANYPGKHNVVNPKGTPVYSSDPSNPMVGAGDATPGFQRTRMTRYLEMLMPMTQEGWAESIGEIPVWMYPMVYQANKDYYGPDFWRVAVQELGARSPFARWLSRLGLGSDADARSDRRQLGGR